MEVSLGEVVSPTHPPKATAAANTYRYLTIQDSDWREKGRLEI